MIDPQIDEAVLGGDWERVLQVALEGSAEESEALVLAWLAGEAHTRLGQRAEAWAVAEPLTKAAATDPLKLSVLCDWVMLGLVARRPDSGIAWTFWANALVHADAYDLAVDKAKHACQLAPDDPWAHIALGHAHSYQGNHDEAETAFSTAIQLDRWCGEAYYCRGLVRYHRGYDCRRGSPDRGFYYNRAVEDFDSALQVDSRDALAWSGKAYALLEVGDTNRAIQAFQEFLSLAPQTGMHPDLLRHAEAQLQRLERNA